jgi:cobyrinic acid a,c-diamide synthase
MDTETRLALIEEEQKRQKLMLDGNGKMGLYDMCNETHRTVRLFARFSLPVIVVVFAAGLAYVGLK